MNKTLKILTLTVGLVGQKMQAQTITETFGTGANQFSIEFVQIGNPGNAADFNVPNPVGSVSYVYSVAKYEVSRGMLIKANAAANLGIVYRDWGVLEWNHPDRAAQDSNWHGAARFVNYLNTSQGFSPAYKMDENGFYLWTSADAGFNQNNLFRNSLAKYILPSVDEWHKAAYGSPDGTWFKYSNGSNSLPESVYEGVTGIVYDKLDQWGGPWRPNAKIYEAGALSPFGTMAQGGNVMEWTETAFDGFNDNPGNADEPREIRGGHIGSDESQINSSWRSSTPTDYGYGIGFRVAMVPEPSALSLLAVGLGGLAMIRRRRS